jgi:cell division protein FtsL
MSAGYMLLLVISAVVLTVSCIWYINLIQTNTNYADSVTSLQEKLTSEKETNDALYDSVVDSVSLTELREKALKMGMRSVEDSQIIEYSSAAEDHVKQYEKIPKSGTLAESEKTKD